MLIFEKKERFQINETKSQLLEKINKIEKSLAILIERKGRGKKEREGERYYQYQK